MKGHSSDLCLSNCPLMLSSLSFLLSVPFTPFLLSDQLGDLKRESPEILLVLRVSVANGPKEQPCFPVVGSTMLQKGGGSSARHPTLSFYLPTQLHGLVALNLSEFIPVLRGGGIGSGSPGKGQRQMLSLVQCRAEIFLEYHGTSVTAVVVHTQLPVFVTCSMFDR